MKKNNFWNDAAKYGAIIGAILAVSFVLETEMTLTGISAYFMMLGIEVIAVIVLHYYLLHRFTRNRARLYTAEEGFSFSQAYSHVLVLSGFAGIIVGVVQAVYLHLILGYSNYVEKYVGALSSVITANGGLPASMENAFAQAFGQLQNAPEPSILRTVWSGTFSSLLFGAIFGLIIAGVLSRNPKPFDTQE